MQLYSIVGISALLFLADLYIYRCLRTGLRKSKLIQSKAFSIAYWAFVSIMISGLFLSNLIQKGMGLRAAVLLMFYATVGCTLFILPFFIADDLRRVFIKISKNKKNAGKATPAFQTTAHGIPRSEFLIKAGLLAGAVPFAGLTIGSISGVYDYKVIRQTLYLPNLPKAFDGITLGQISDIHSGSFYNKTAVNGGIDLLLKEKPDFIFFTGDLVNDNATEMKDYQDMFSKVKAPLGVFSSLGNHDYGDYSWWPSEAAKRKNLDDLCATHKHMGWDLLRNENRRLKVGGEEIGILGVENWGSLSRFPKYGRVDLALKDTADLPVKLLLSHDPSHWRAQVLDKHPEIDVMFSGHTHGMQFGIRTPGFQWSPIKYIYPEWAGLYKENHQQLYVNVGYGFLGYPGRLGILPEITIFTLKSGKLPEEKQRIS
jgi:predicted MPP superfamily phosphohydrolase